MRQILKIILFSLFLFSQLGLYGQEKTNSIGIYYSQKFNYFSSKEIIINDWLSYDFSPKFSYNIGIEYTRSGIVNKHLGIFYSSSSYTTNYHYYFEINEKDKDKLIGREEFNNKKINLEIGLSKTLNSQKKFNIIPVLFIVYSICFDDIYDLFNNWKIDDGEFIPINSTSNIRSYSISGNKLNTTMGLPDLDNYSLPYIKFSPKFSYSISEHFAIQLSPFVETYFNIKFGLFKNYNNTFKLKYVPNCSYGASIYFLFQNF